MTTSSIKVEFIIIKIIEHILFISALGYSDKNINIVIDKKIIIDYLEDTESLYHYNDKWDIELCKNSINNNWESIVDIIIPVLDNVYDFEFIKFKTGNKMDCLIIIELCLDST